MAPMVAAASPDPETIRETARAILAGPDYHLQPLTDSDFALLRYLWHAIQWVLSPFTGLFHSLWDVSPALAIVYIIVLVLILVLLIWHIAYSFRAAMRGRVEGRIYRGIERREVQPADLEALAGQAAERQDYIVAVRYLFQACLLRLEPPDRRKVRIGATNHEHLRRFRGTPCFEPLRRFVETIDYKWYGGGQCGAVDFDNCRQAYGEILLQRGT